MRVLTTISRVLVGLLFIFSGWIKANDPLGFSYKLEEYYHVFHLDFLASSALVQAMFICILEMVLGVAVLLGTRMRLTASLLLGMMVFFTLLTGYTAISNWFFENPESGTTKWFANLLGFEPRKIYYMTDCGCFGEFLKLTPWQSFAKDLVLMVFVIIIFIRRKHTRSLFSRTIQTNIIATFTIVFTLFTVWVYLYLPYVNFLNWKEGNDVATLITCPPDAPKDSLVQVFVYKVNGVPTDFSYEEMMAMKIPEGAEFVTRKDKLVKEGCRPKIVGFTMYKGDADYKDSMLWNPGYQMLVVSPDLHKARKGAMKKLGKLSEELVKDTTNTVKMWGIAANSEEEMEKFRHEYGLMYDYYRIDNKMAKSMIRSNPGIILMKGSVVIETWPARSVPSAEKVRKIIEKHKKKNGK